MDLGEIDLDHTLSCGQAFRWRKQEGRWRGIIAGKEIVLERTGKDIDVQTSLSDRAIRDYFRCDDNAEEILADIGKDGTSPNYCANTEA